MTQTQRRLWLIRELLYEEGWDTSVPDNEAGQRRLLRSLFNARMPLPVSEKFLQVQDAYLQEEIRRKGITKLAELRPVGKEIYLWQGDITTLRCDAIVNAANSALLGCFIPCHACIDNAIHTFAGVQLRLACADIMQKQGIKEETGRAKITPAFNLPSRYVLHTVGPVISGRVTGRDRDLLASCYRSCLELAEQNGCGSIAFCCISTGEFHFPNAQAAGIAIDTVTEYKQRKSSDIKVIFNVFKDEDYAIYRWKLGAD